MSQNQNRIAAAIIGGSGYGANELLRLLKNHPEVDVLSIVSRSLAGKPIATAHSHLSEIYDLKFSHELEIEKLENYNHKIIFTALPHGVSIEYVSKLLKMYPEQNLRIIDLSGDLRLKDPEQHKKHYPGCDFNQELRSRFVSGITELNRAEIRKAQHISNPGCYPTVSSLAAAPLFHAKLTSGPLFINGASGSSGAGRGLSEKFHHPARHSSAMAYKVLQHRHEPEVHQALGDPACKSIETAFVPHVIPVSRGIYITEFVQLKESHTTQNLFDLYKDFYKDDFFIRIKDAPPELSDVVGSNFCDIHISARGNQAVVCAVEDNLIKGMAGQAIQNMNVMLGLDETSGLTQAPLGII